MPTDPLRRATAYLIEAYRSGAPPTAQVSVAIRPEKIHITREKPDQPENVVAGVVKGYAVNPVQSPQGLEDHVLISVRAGSGGAFSSCTGFTADEK